MTRTDEFSPYSRSKAEGERSVLAYGRRVVVFRPPGVHAAERRVSQRIAKLARSPLASVARPGTQPSPQALAPNVGAAITYLALCDIEPPSIVIHPSEGVTTTSLLSALGGKPPRQVPNLVARTIVSLASLAGRRSARIAGNARRLELLWFGQEQDESWLTRQGWVPPVSRDGWHQLAEELQMTTGNERGMR